MKWACCDSSIDQPCLHGEVVQPVQYVEQITLPDGTTFDQTLTEID